jgi:hypothetical protein
MAMDGSTAVIGDPVEGSVRTYTQFAFRAKLTASGWGENSGCGNSVAISGDTVVVGCGVSGGGLQAAYVFRGQGGFYTLEQILTPNERPGSDHYVASVAVSGDTIILGTPEEGISTASDRQGAAWVFRRTGSTWTQTQKLTGDSPTLGFGRSVSIHNRDAIIGEAESAYLFSRPNGVDWIQQQTLTPSDGDSGDEFGASVVVRGDYAIVGAHADTIAGNARQGSAYLFHRSGSSWTELQKITEGDADDHFGHSISMDGTTAVFGAWGADSGTGAAYVWAPAPPPTPPSVPALQYPNGAIVTTNWPFYQFYAVDRATRYVLRVSGIPDQAITPSEGDCTIPTSICIVYPTILLPNGEHSWQVQAQNEHGASAWSGALNFSINGTPTAPLPPRALNPVGSISNPTPLFRISRSAGATHYTIWVNDASVANTNTKYSMLVSMSAAELGCAYGGTCSFTPTVPLAPGAGKWWVRASNALGSSTWSPARNFVLPGAPAVPTEAPVLVAPLGTVEPAAPAFTWKGVPDATAYELWVNDNSGVRLKQMYTAHEAGCSSGMSCSVSPAVDVGTGAINWWVRIRAAGGFGPWSVRGSFNIGPEVAPGAATLIAPSGAIGSRTPGYIWSAVPGATGYQLWVNDVSSGYAVDVTITPAEAGCGDGSCTVVPSAELAPGPAAWWIRPYNAAGSGPWAKLSFMVP